MTSKLSVNLNKVALIRNSRGNNNPDVLKIAKQCLDIGAHGITVHPRPDERHIKFSDLQPLKVLCANYPHAEFNIEGYPSDHFISVIREVRPDQATFVPDPPEALTSSFGWNLKENQSFLSKITTFCSEFGIRSSLFINPSLDGLDCLKVLGADRVELYTYDYAHFYNENKQLAIKPYLDVVSYILQEIPNLGINAGHDLDQNNLSYLLSELKVIKEVSIGHALICEALQQGLSTTLKAYLDIVNNR